LGPIGPAVIDTSIGLPVSAAIIPTALPVIAATGALIVISALGRTVIATAISRAGRMLGVITVAIETVGGAAIRGIGADIALIAVVQAAIITGIAAGRIAVGRDVSGQRQ
jgi:hypothetical protein